MENRIVVTGGRPLSGAVRVPAAKNSVLPLLAASMLCGNRVRLRVVPRLSDVDACIALLRGAGCAARWDGEDVVVDGPPRTSTLPGETAGQMRASILFCAPLLARLGRAETQLPGGCKIGARPIDLHLAGLRQMGAVEWETVPGKLVLTAPSGLHGAEITLHFPSVGATETLLLAAVCAKGKTVLRGAALRLSQAMQENLFSLPSDAPAVEAVRITDGSWQLTLSGKGLGSMTAVCPSGSRVYLAAAGEKALHWAKI